MTWKPGRAPLVLNQPGNPFQPGPSLQHPGTNPSGLLPGTPTTPRGLEAWSGGRAHQAFASDGTNQVWTWSTPVFDLRPGVSAAYGHIAPAVPINHEGALGQSIYLEVTIGEETGTVPPAGAFGLLVEYWEDGNPLWARNGELQRLTQDLDITEQVLAGGTSLVVPFGSSPLSFTPCIPSLRFWKLSLRLTFDGVLPIALPYFIDAMLH